MTKKDEKELQRLSGMLGDIDAQLPSDSPLKEGLTKASIALGIAFINGTRPEIEAHFEELTNG